MKYLLLLLFLTGCDVHRETYRFTIEHEGKTLILHFQPGNCSKGPAVDNSGKFKVRIECE